MNNTGYSVIAFLSGAAIAALIAWKVTDKFCSTKYEKIAQDEINSVKKRFTVPKADKNEKKEETKEEVAKKAADKPSLNEYANRIREYTNYSGSKANELRQTIFDSKAKKPIVITPDEYADEEDYAEQNLTLYADGILADEDDTILEADEVLGVDNIDRIGEYEDDALHVRDDVKKIYYEVLADERSYKDATGKDPSSDKDEEDE